MTIAYIALGSNVGERAANLSAAVKRLRGEPGVRVLKVSPFFATAPVGCPPGSGEFLNAAAAIETDLPPHDLLALLLKIERQFGRVRTEPNSPRTLDLDLLLYDDHVLDTPDLVVPHPRMHERAFVLVPLAAIAPDAVHPVLKKTVRELVAELPDAGGVNRVPREEPPAVRDLTGSHALVTGSSSGIGRVTAVTFAKRGAEVFFHGARPGPRLDDAIHEGWLQSREHGVGCHGIRADLRDAAETDRLAQDAWEISGGLDILVLNAGIDTLTGDAAKWSFDQKLDALLAVDLKATMRLARDIGGRMKARGRGCVITIGWDQAETGMEGDSGELFAAVKGAVMCFTRSLALSLAPEVRVNCIAPGWIRTAWGQTASAEWQERVRRETPLERWGLAEDIAAAAAWLASPAAAFVTGQTIRVNGGAIRA